MTQSWMLAISIGPVGNFIAAGRRSRDLWWGSTWLSKLVRDMVTQELTRAEGAEVLLPDAKYLVDTGETCHGGRVANKLLIVVQGEEARVATLAGQLRQWAHHWLARQVNDSLGGLGKELVNAELFGEQVDAIRDGDFVEFRAGWAPAELGFQVSVAEARRLCGASPRLFPKPSSKEGAYKSHLDPGSDSVLIPGDSAYRARIGLRAGEQLDALSLARRLARFKGRADLLGALPFPSVARVAMEPWLTGAQAANRGLMDWLLKQLNVARRSEDFFPWCSPATNPATGSGADFPYDSSFLLDGDLEARSKDATLRKWDDRDLRALEPAIKRLHSLRGAPLPYYALIEMDGDGVGEALKLDREPWQEAIRSLYRFTNDAVQRLARHGAVAIYAAGDELLLYAPVDTALELTRELSELWSIELKSLSKTSLSAGVVFAHVKDDLTDTRKAAHQALEKAKLMRRGTHTAHLCVQERPRGGSPRTLCGPLAPLVQTLTHWATALDVSDTDPLSLRSAHILDEHILRLEDSAGSTLIAQGALLRQVGKRPTEEDVARGRGESVGRTELRSRVERLEDRGDLERLRDELLIAARIRRVAAQREGKV